MRILPLLGAALGVSAAVGGGVLYRPELVATLSGRPPVAVQATTVANTSGSAADRATVVAGVNPVTGDDPTASRRVDRSLLGLPRLPVTPSVQLPELVLRPPGPGTAGRISTRSRNEQFGQTVDWTPQAPVNGPVSRMVRTAASDSYVVVPTQPGELHLLCNVSRGSYYVDGSSGQWRVSRVDGGPHYDFSYRFVRFDKSPLGNEAACQ